MPSQWYSDTAHVHAVTHLTGTQKFWYDANGNMTTRDAQALTYDAENRLTQVVSGTVTADYTCDGDGARVTRTDGATTISSPPPRSP